MSGGGPVDKFPERVNAMYVVSYDPLEVRGAVAELNDMPVDEVPFEEVMNLIATFISEDFAGLDIREVIIQDEAGAEVDW